MTNVAARRSSRLLSIVIILRWGFVLGFVGCERPSSSSSSQETLEAGASAVFLFDEPNRSIVDRHYPPFDWVSTGRDSLGLPDEWHTKCVLISKSSPKSSIEVTCFSSKGGRIKVNVSVVGVKAAKPIAFSGVENVESVLIRGSDGNLVAFDGWKLDRNVLLVYIDKWISKNVWSFEFSCRTVGRYTP